MNGRMGSESWVEFLWKQTLRQSYCAGCLLRDALEINTCGRKGKEAGLGRREVKLQCRSNNSLGQHHGEL